MSDPGKILSERGITEYGILDFGRLRIIYRHLLPGDADIKSAVVFLIPYRRSDAVITDAFNAGLFARCRDYHIYAKHLFEGLLPDFTALTGGKAYGFADSSPIDEKDAAEKCGIGFIGKNGLLINKKYGSFVFIAELLSEVRLPERVLSDPGSCGGCGLCVSACPTGALNGGTFSRAECLSAISQKKLKTEAELQKLRETKTVWGCDICQTVCPYSKNTAYSTAAYFKKGFISSFSAALLDNMDKKTYMNYSFSYRKKEVILENFLTAENKRDIIKTK